MPSLAPKHLCTGCTACSSTCSKGCISMVADSDGFLFPEVNSETCISCGLCEKACPVLKKPELHGDSPTAYAAYSKDKYIRMGSSSGGVFSELALGVLAQGGTVFGAAYNEQFDVVHICVESEADLGKLRGAKYAQSNLGNTFVDVKARLENGRKVLFSGTPCQVAGLKSFLHNEYENLICVDFVCHGVPSPMVWKAYVEYRADTDNGGQLPRSINLRSKETGWSRYRYSNAFEYESGIRNVCSSSDSLFMKLFVGDYICRLSCENCPAKGYSRISDLTIGDFWGIWNIEPDMDDDCGTSLILCQSDDGVKLLERVVDKLVIKRVKLEEVSLENGSILTASRANLRRREALDLIKAGNIAACESWFQKPPKAMIQKLRYMIVGLLRKN